MLYFQDTTAILNQSAIRTDCPLDKDELGKKLHEPDYIIDLYHR